jgi:hypothetical protein
MILKCLFGGTVQKVSAQLEASKPAPQMVDIRKTAPAFHNQPSRFTVWRLFVSPAHGSLKSPVCSCVSITLPARIVNANHGIM